MGRIDWAEGSWLNEPPLSAVDGAILRVTTGRDTDMWRHTSYGFVRDSGHALLAGLADADAMECDVEADYREQFDQAGILVWAGPTTWIKCGIEYADAQPHLGAVVTDEKSDWSAHPVPGWDTGVTTLRVSRSGDALTIRAKRADQPWQLVRLAPLDPQLEWRAGPYAASPSREGLQVGFSQWCRLAADRSLHEVSRHGRGTPREPR